MLHDIEQTPLHCAAKLFGAKPCRRVREIDLTICGYCNIVGIPYGNAVCYGGKFSDRPIRSNGQKSSERIRNDQIAFAIEINP